MARKPTSYVLWRGPSAIDGKPIVVVATGVIGTRGGVTTKNRKTGKMTQIWIMPANPQNLIKQVLSGEDESVCGRCPWRPMLARMAGQKIAGKDKQVCYVYTETAMGFGPSTVAKNVMNGKYPQMTEAEVPRLLGNRNGIRWGAYGDPLAVPFEALTTDAILRHLTNGAIAHTGYTHRWREVPESQRLWAQQWLMASVDSPLEAAEASSCGWRYFRTRSADQPLGEREKVCPASKEAGMKTTCDRCQQCNGTLRNPQRPNFVIIAH